MNYTEGYFEKSITQVHQITGIIKLETTQVKYLSVLFIDISFSA